MSCSGDFEAEVAPLSICDIRFAACSEYIFHVGPIALVDLVFLKKRPRRRGKLGGLGVKPNKTRTSGEIFRSGQKHDKHDYPKTQTRSSKSSFAMNSYMHQIGRTLMVRVGQSRAGGASGSFRPANVSKCVSKAVIARNSASRR